MPTDRDTPTKDPQDQAFGAAAAEDQERADDLERQGAHTEDLPDAPARAPRAAGKAAPDVP